MLGDRKEYTRENLTQADIESYLSGSGYWVRGEWNGQDPIPVACANRYTAFAQEHCELPVDTVVCRLNERDGVFDKLALGI